MLAKLDCQHDFEMPCKRKNITTEAQRGTARWKPKPSLPHRDNIIMSLRESETTEAISQGSKNTEIAALSSVARNDKQRL